MGGENSMITDHVTTMLFEAACFDGTNIRKSGKRIGLRTDASAKFEKGLDPNLAMEAMNRACQLVEELGAGEVVGGAVDIYPVKREGVKIPFEPDKYNKLLGTDIPAGDMIGYFKKIDLGYDEATNEILVPSWRQDLLCDADMAEEVARFYGYDKIGTSLPSGESTAGGKSFKLRMEEKAREIAEFCGFSQAMTYSFESPKVFDKLLIPEDSKWRKTVVISNPLGEDYSIMRTLPLNGMLTSLSTNFGRRNKDVRLYEMGNIYLPKQLPLTELPEERMQLTFGMYGDGDFFTMKGVIEELLYQTGLRKKAQYDPHAELPFLHPGRKAAIVYEGAVIGYLGEVHPTVAANYAIKERVYIAVIDMPEIVSRASFDYKYEGITNFPVSSRDLSMVVPKNILVGDIEKVFEENGGKYLENYELFDVYEGEQIEKGFKSVAYSLKFRGKDKNLEESDITGAMDKNLKRTEKYRNPVERLIMTEGMNVKDYDYDLPEELIAQDPLEDRSSSRLMVLDRQTGDVEHRHFTDILEYLHPGDCLVINNTKVIPARLFGVKEDTQAKIEVLLLKRKENDIWETLVKPGKKAKPGTKLVFGDGLLTAEVVDVVEEGNRLIQFHYDGIFEEILDQLGQMPLPPYITHQLKDKNRYQTVYAKYDGSAAAPTAGLHFTKELLQKVKDMGVDIAEVTLHVGLGTFRPVKVENVLDHHMHSEFYMVSQEAADKINRAKESGHRVIAVGTTSTRTLEAAADENGRLHETSGWTEIFIYPGYQFKVIDALITNFHLPQSTLVMLVSALAGREHVLHAYEIAVKERYRFFSFGDAMLIQ